jgi:hypothetical protein
MATHASWSSADPAVTYYSPNDIDFKPIDIHSKTMSSTFELAHATKGTSCYYLDGMDKKIFTGKSWIISTKTPITPGLLELRSSELTLAEIQFVDPAVSSSSSVLGVVTSPPSTTAGATIKAVAVAISFGTSYKSANFKRDGLSNLVSGVAVGDPVEEAKVVLRIARKNGIDTQKGLMEFLVSHSRLCSTPNPQSLPGFDIVIVLDGADLDISLPAAGGTFNITSKDKRILRRALIGVWIQLFESQSPANKDTLKSLNGAGKGIFNSLCCGLGVGAMTLDEVANASAVFFKRVAPKEYEKSLLRGGVDLEIQKKAR